MGSFSRVQRLVAEQVGDRHFRRRNQPVVGILQLEKILRELRQLARSIKARRVDGKRRQHFRIAMLARMRVQHEVDQRALQLRAQPKIDGKPGAGDFGSPVEIENSQVGADIPMRLGFEVECAGLAERAYHQIVVGGLPDRHRLMRNVRNASQQLAIFRIGFIGDRGESGNPLADFAGHTLQIGSVCAFFAQPGDFARLQVLVPAQFFALGDGSPALRVEFAELSPPEAQIRAWTSAAQWHPDWRETSPCRAYRRMLAGGANVASEMSMRCGRPVEVNPSLLLVGLGGDRLKVFGFEDLPAVDALHVVHAVSSGENDGFLMLAGGLHNERLRYELL